MVILFGLLFIITSHLAFLREMGTGKDNIWYHT